VMSRGGYLSHGGRWEERRARVNVFPHAAPAVATNRSRGFTRRTGRTASMPGSTATATQAFKATVPCSRSRTSSSSRHSR
jgi:hypothetical protein